MTVRPVVIEMQCDHWHDDGQHCSHTLTGFGMLGELGLLATAKKRGWQHGVRADGHKANRNGRDYCPEHRRPR